MFWWNFQSNERRYNVFWTVWNEVRKSKLKGLWKIDTHSVTVPSFYWQKWFSETSSSTRAVTSLTLTSLSTSRCGERPCSTLWVGIWDVCNGVKVTLASQLVNMKEPKKSNQYKGAWKIKYYSLSLLCQGEPDYPLYGDFFPHGPCLLPSLWQWREGASISNNIVDC